MKNLEPAQRALKIIKLLHEKEMRTGELAEYFQVDERTIRSDIDKLRMGMDFFGTKIKAESRHPGSQKHHHISTIHPLMLALNLSELLMLLKLLEANFAGNGGDIYESIFKQVYGQITNYAEEMIKHHLTNEYDKEDAINFLEEEAFKKNKDYKLLMWLKSGKYIKITFRNREDEQFTEEARLLDFNDNNYRIKTKEGKKEWIGSAGTVIDWTNLDYK